MTEEAARAAESMVEQQVREAYQTVTHILNEQPISTVLEAFWDILLAKPHRCSCFVPLFVAPPDLQCRMLVPVYHGDMVL